MKFNGYNLHTNIKQYEVLIQCNIQVSSTNNYRVKNIINTVLMN